MFFQCGMNSGVSEIPALPDPFISIFGQVGIFSCLPFLLPLIFHFRFIYKANMENVARYFSFFAYNIVIYACLAVGQARLASRTGKIFQI